jgi:hypothetical protein
MTSTLTASADRERDRAREPSAGSLNSPSRSVLKGTYVEIRIGIVNAPRELSFESSQSPDELTEQVQNALTSGTGFLRLTDDKGRVYIVPTAGVAYVEVGPEESRRIGFVG